MLKYVLLAVFAGLGWFVFVDGSKLDEADVRAYYLAQRDATLALDADTLCAMLSKDASGRLTSRSRIIRHRVLRSAEVMACWSPAVTAASSAWTSLSWPGNGMSGRAWAFMRPILPGR